MNKNQKIAAIVAAALIVLVAFVVVGNFFFGKGKQQAEEESAQQKIEALQAENEALHAEKEATEKHLRDSLAAAQAAKEKEAEKAREAAKQAAASGPVTTKDGYRAYNYGRSYVTRFNSGDTGEYNSVQILNEGGWTNIRSGASGSSAIVAKVKDGSYLLVDLEHYGAWYRVSDFNFRPLGYIHSSKLVR